MKTENFWIEKLNLEKHPEGGYFKEVYRSKESINKNALPSRFKSDRNFATSIYFLLKGTDFSSFHRIQSDETWHFYQGSALQLFVLDHDGILVTHLLGTDFESGERLQITIPKNNWFGARVIDKSSYSLLGCTVAPGFHFDDFELAKRTNLLQEFPDHKEIITDLTLS